VPIRVSCSCGKSLRAPDSAAGKRLRCPGCGQMIALPESAPSAPLAATIVSTSRPVVHRELRSAALYAGLLLILGGTGCLAAWQASSRVPRLRANLISLGRTLPALQNMLSWFHLESVSLLVAVAAAGATLLPAARRAQGARPPWLAVPLCLVLAQTGLCFLYLFLVLCATVDCFRSLDGGPAAGNNILQDPPDLPLLPVPGKGAAIADDVVAAVRIGLREQYHRFSLGDTKEICAFIYMGPGVTSSVPSDLSLSAARGLDNCVFLPSAGPTGVDVAMVPRPDPSKPPWSGSIDSERRKTLGSAYWNRSWRIPGDEVPPYSYALELSPAKVDSNGDGKVDSQDSYGGDLYELRVYVFRGFDSPAADLFRSLASTDPSLTIPRVSCPSGVPYLEKVFRTLVHR